MERALHRLSPFILGATLGTLLWCVAGLAYVVLFR